MTTTTKEQLLSGSRPKPFTVQTDEGPSEVMLRQLSAGEAEEVQVAQTAGISLDATSLGGRQIGKAARRVEPQMAVDMPAVVKGNARAQQLAAAYGLVEPALTLDEVKAAPAALVEQIGEEVMRRSGLGSDSQAQLQRFRSFSNGTGDAAAAPVGQPAGDDAG